MKKIQALFLCLAFMLMGYSASLHAEDIDLYVDNSASSGVPNVMFVMDNGANFSEAANGGTGCTAYNDGSGEAPSLGTNKASGILQCALVDAINALPAGAVNIGVAVSNGNNFGETQATTDTTKGGYHELCHSSGIGGCIIRNLGVMDAAGKASLIKFIKGWKDAGQSDANGFNIKVNTAYPATSLQEVWAYYNGKTGMSGKTYSTSILANGCQKNFLVYITNTSSDPANESNPSPLDALKAAQTGSTAAQQASITGTVKFNPSVCGGVSSYTLESGNNWADEWARLMYQQDGGAEGNANVQNIISYTVAILGPDNKCSTHTLGLASSIAKHGGGKFFMTSNVSDLANALNQVLNEVQAVNSVFSSASLPVSVNAEGSYLNQVYLGMFRPDSGAAPRWMGNLKQYQLIKNNSGTLVLGDAQGNGAISSAGTGFISPNATSFWTYKNTGAAPDDSTTGGMWVNDPKGTPANAFDSPDGEVVEKGGVAQQLRKESLKADFTATEESTNNPRRLYTYCPGGGTCEPALTHSSNAFSTGNAAISSSAFGSSSTVKVASITRSGTTATYTTSSAHGFSAGTSVTISNATPSDYNGTFTIATVPSSTTFTVNGFNDYPTSPSAGTYTVTPVSASSIPISTMTRTTSASGNSTETATVTTSSAHGFTNGQSITITGAAQSAYNGTFTITYISATQFSFSVPITPSVTSSGWSAALSSAGNPPITGVSMSNPSTGVLRGTTTSAHGFHVGQTLTVSGVSNTYNGTYVLTAVTSTTFEVNTMGNGFKNKTTETNATVTPSYTGQTVSLSRSSTADSVTVTATGAAPNWFGTTAGNTRIVQLSKTGATASESGYAFTGTITCQNTGCTTFTYSTATSPASTATAATNQTLTAAPQSASAPVTLAAGRITRNGTTATVTGLPAGTFTNVPSVTIAASGTALATESAYVGNWTITCTDTDCTTFTFGPVTLSPSTPATGSNIQAFSGSTPPDKNTIIRWVRGHDNADDEKGPGKGVTVRPSIHGDVLHSRPLVINYGTAKGGIVVFYGSNDGVYRAVNGNQTTAITSASGVSVPSGGELWGLVLPEHFGSINRLRLNSPELKFPSTNLATAQRKDYFVDGSTGVYQKLGDGDTIAEAYIYLTMRRGGRFMYALDVSEPKAPKVAWTKSNASTGFEELGQTWSRPKSTLLESAVHSATPVIVFGAGYDPEQDDEPPGTDTMGRGIFIVNAKTGDLIWSASPSCTASATCTNVPEMKYSVPGEIAFVDRNADGYTDKMYFGDLGGNIWRVDVPPTASDEWKVTRIAAFGCDNGECTETDRLTKSPRKFFFPPAIMPVGKAGAANSFDVVAIASGDREHPLKSTASTSAYNVENKFLMVMDKGTARHTPVTQNVKYNQLDLIEDNQWDRESDSVGFQFGFATGEKAVNAPTAINGMIFFATNRPMDSTVACAANLGEAKAYAVSPFSGEASSNVLAGGGMPPTPVAGVVLFTQTNPDGTTTTTQERFCMGCGVDPLGDQPPSADCEAGIGACTPTAPIAKKMKRTYWYRK